VLFNEAAPLSPPQIRMRPSGNRAAAEFVRGCDRLTAGLQAPIVVDGRVALRIPAKEISARRIHRSLGARFIAMPRKIDMGEGLKSLATASGGKRGESTPQQNRFETQRTT
jgi:hypothetical protein